ncbi:MAG TPA: hypothetical protein VMY42_06730 [Thermoguttaceae bacterium]|nr:hypothetical protein [Thermoguttaceae bacterium]
MSSRADAIFQTAAAAHADVFADTSAVVVVTDPDGETATTLDQPILGAIETREEMDDSGKTRHVFRRTLGILRTEIDRPKLRSTVSIDSDEWHINEILRQGPGITTAELYQGRLARAAGEGYTRG